jgi:glycolate oxidase FAD binding subunit
VNAWPEAPALLAHAGNGVVVGHLPASLTLERARELVTTLRTLATRAGGQVVLVRCPTEWKAALSVWGPPRGDVQLMRAVKEQLDPKGIFNPGRFVDGI